MKKRYKKPDIIVERISDVSPILATSFSIDNESQGDFREDFIRRRRGTWGNLWQNNYWDKDNI